MFDNVSSVEPSDENAELALDQKDSAKNEQAE